jgi:hypothetical protein
VRRYLSDDARHHSVSRMAGTLDRVSDCMSISAHPNAHTQHIKVPKHFVYIQYNMNAGSSLKPVVASTITLQHHGLRSTPKTPKSTRDLQRGTAVRVVPYAHTTPTQHIKVRKHFVYIQYGCGIQSEACCSLNHDITISHGLRSTPIIPKSTPDLQRGYHGKGGPICPYTAYQGTKTLCIHPIWMRDPV